MNQQSMDANILNESPKTNKNKFLLIIIIILLLIIAVLSFIVLSLYQSNKLNNEENLTLEVEETNETDVESKQDSTPNKDTPAEEVVSMKTFTPEGKFENFSLQYNENKWEVQPYTVTQTPYISVDFNDKEKSNTLFNLVLSWAPESMIQSNMAFFCAETANTSIVKEGVRSGEGIDKLGYFTEGMIRIKQANGEYRYGNKYYKVANFEDYNGTNIENGYCINTYGTVSQSNNGEVFVATITIPATSNITEQDLKSVDVTALTAAFN